MMLLQAGQAGLFRRESIMTDALPPDMVAGFGFWIDGTDSEWLFDVAGNTNITANGDPVGRAVNRCNTLNWAGQLYTTPDLLTPSANGMSALEFPSGIQTSGMGVSNVGGALPISSFVTSTTKTIVAAVKVASASATAGSPWNNPAIVSDSAQYVGLHVSDDGVTGFLSARAYNYASGANEAVVPFPKDEYVVLTMWHQSGQLRVRCNGGSWSQTASGTTGNVSSDALIGAWFALPGLSLELAHLAMANTAQTEATISAVERWLAADCAITPW